MKTKKYRNKKNKKINLKSHKGGVIECVGIEGNEYDSGLLNLPISLIHIIGDKCIDERGSLLILSETCQKLYCICYQQEEGDINLILKQKNHRPYINYMLCQETFNEMDKMIENGDISLEDLPEPDDINSTDCGRCYACVSLSGVCQCPQESGTYRHWYLTKNNLSP